MKALVLLLSAVSLVLAQDSISVQVGATSSSPGGALQFIPNNFKAKNGTVIRFLFTGAPGNHSVTQSSFAVPCEPLAAGGFDSGWVFIPGVGATPFPEWNVTITDDSKPIWFFCKQLLQNPHCSSGMVGAINAPETGNTFEAFLANAESFSGPSGQGQGFIFGPGASASAIPTPIPSGASLYAPPDPTATPTPVAGTNTVTNTGPTNTLLPPNTGGAPTLSAMKGGIMGFFAAISGLISL